MTATDLRRRRWIGALGSGLLGVFGPFGVSANAEPPERVVTIVARKFSFTPDRIELVAGRPVRLALTTLDLVMGFACSELGLRADIVPDRVTTLRFTPVAPGLIQFSCDVFCGSGHEEMSGAFHVT